MHSHSQPGLGVRRLIAAGLLMAALGVPSPAPAQQATAPSPAPVPPALAADAPPRVGSTLERHIESLRSYFVHLDADRDGKITHRDVDLHTLWEAAVLRTFAMQMVMVNDLDGDGAVTENEIRQVEKYQGRGMQNEPDKQVDDKVRKIMALDTDKDGKVSAIEAAKYTYPQLYRDLGYPDKPERARKALTIESSTKGEITWQDYEPPGIALFRKVDADGDGKISQAELDAYRKTR